MRKLKIVEVEWEDANSYQGWQSPADVSVGVTICHSVGMVFKEDRNVLALCCSVAKSPWGENSVSDIINIPKKSILMRRVLRG